MKAKESAEIDQILTLLPSWRISLQAGNKSKATLATYTSAVEMFTAFLRRE